MTFRYWGKAQREGKKRKGQNKERKSEEMYANQFIMRLSVDHVLSIQNYIFIGFPGFIGFWVP